MRTRTVGWMAAAAIAMLAQAGGAAAQAARPSGTGASGAWLHVRVQEAKRQSSVAVNLPLSVVEVALQAAPEHVASHGRVHLGHEGHDVSVADLRRMWRELKDAGDTDFATVEEDDQTVRVARAGNLVLVHVNKPGHAEAVRVEVPVDVVDALLSGEGDELDVRAALAQLQKRRGDIVKVDDEGSTVRIWIDEEK